VFSLTERSAEALVADQAFAPGLPGLVGVAVDLLLDDPGVPGSLAGSLAQRPPLRHGFLTARSSRVLVVSGPPSPGVDTAAARMGEDLPMPLPLIGGHRVAILQEAADAIDPLAAAFANAPLRHGRPTGWRSARQALRRDLPVVPPGADPRAAWVAYVMDAPVANAPSPITRRAPRLSPCPARPGSGSAPPATHSPTRPWRTPRGSVSWPPTRPSPARASPATCGTRWPLSPSGTCSAVAARPTTSSIGRRPAPERTARPGQMVGSCLYVGPAHCSGAL
jgi:hypothetical protein